MRLGTTRKRVGLLALLAAAWALLLVLGPDQTSGTRSPAPRAATDAGRDASGGGRRGPAAPGEARSGTRLTGEVPRFREDLLRLGPGDYPEVARDPFILPPPPAPKVIAAPPPPPPPPPIVVAPPPPPPPPPPPDPFFEEWRQYRLLGTAEDADGRHAFVTHGTDLLIVRPDDPVGARYVVKEIRDEAVVLTSAERDKEVVLPLPAERPAEGRGPGRPVAPPLPRPSPPR